MSEFGGCRTQSLALERRGGIFIGACHATQQGVWLHRRCRIQQLPLHQMSMHSKVNSEMGYQLECVVQRNRAYGFTDGAAFNNETEANDSGVIFKVGSHTTSTLAL